MFRRLFALFFVFVLLAVPVSAADDPPDPDYGGTADQDPANQGWGEQGDVSLQDFGNTDSSNLSNISTATKSIDTNIQKWLYPIYQDVGYIQSDVNVSKQYLYSINSNISNIKSTSDLLDTALKSNGLFYKMGSDVTSINSRINTTNSKIDVTNSKLDTVNSSITSQTSVIQSNHKELLEVLRGDYSAFQPVLDTPFSSNNRFFTTAVYMSLSGVFPSFTRQSDGSWYNSSYADFQRINFEMSYTNPVLTDSPPYLAPSHAYRVSLSYFGTFDSFGFISFGAQNNGRYKSSDLSVSTAYSRTVVTLLVVPTDAVTLSAVVFFMRGSLTPGSVSLSIVRDDSSGIDYNFESSVNSGQAAATDQLQGEVDKMESFDSQIFEDVNNYTKQLDFGLSDWGEAASGISYISSIFMMIWDGSPKQPIILSLMIGLCLLILGRGARLAGEVRRSNDRAERAQRRTRGG